MILDDRLGIDIVVFIIYILVSSWYSILILINRLLDNRDLLALFGYLEIKLKR